MKKILSAVVATLAAMSFTAVVFAADVTVQVPDSVTNAAGNAQKKVDAANAKAKEAKEAKAKAKAAAAAKAKEAKEAKTKAKAAAKDKAKAKVNSAIDSAIPTAK